MNERGEQCNKENLVFYRCCTPRALTQMHNSRPMQIDSSVKIADEANT